MVKIGFVVNPIAGMGGRVGLKGTDGVLQKAVVLGASPIAPQRALEMLQEFVTKYSTRKKAKWITCTGQMGSDILEAVGVDKIELVYDPLHSDTDADDTKTACQRFLKSTVDLVLFCGGDGTARDIYSVIDKKIPMLGIPSGVKMHSGVFGITVKATAKMLHEFIQQNLTIGDVEIMDLDEERYRKGEWNIQLFGIASGIVEPTYVQVGKMSFASVSDDDVKEELSEHIEDEMEANKECLYLFGSGGTIDHIARIIGVDNTLLGIDAVYQMKTIEKDLNEERILRLLDKYKQAKVIVSPIGAQGFILGRGNLQFSPQVINSIGVDNIIVVSTPSKLAGTPVIRVDTGDENLDRLFKEKELIMVVIGYRLSRVVKIQTNNF